MLMTLSPAKSLDESSPLRPDQWAAATEPLFVPQAQRLVSALKRKSARSVAALMDLSPALAELNVQRYKAWESAHSQANARPAVLAFDGDVYGGLQARAMNEHELAFAQAHLVILSGLYGALRPMDWLQPYRLEMGSALGLGKAKNLYAYWGEQVSAYLASRLAEQAEPVLVNLASQEYFKVVRPKALGARVVHCQFEDWQGGRYKIISFFAKKARGLMARYAITQGITQAEALQGFDAEGYAFAPQASSADQWVFRRRPPAT